MQNEEWKSGVICALITFSFEITFEAHITHNGYSKEWKTLLLKR